MSAIQKIEQRLSALETEVAKLKEQTPDQKKPWWEDWFGAFENDPYFEEAMKLGKKWREAQTPKPKRKRQATNGHS